MPENALSLDKSKTLLFGKELKQDLVLHSHNPIPCIVSTKVSACTT